MENKISKQRRWQIRKKTEGMCQRCGDPAVRGANYCDICGDKRRTRARNKYRRKAGIPLNAPVADVGRKPVYA